MYITRFTRSHLSNECFLPSTGRRVSRLKLFPSSINFANVSMDGACSRKYSLWYVKRYQKHCGKRRGKSFGVFVPAIFFYRYVKQRKLINAFYYFWYRLSVDSFNITSQRDWISKGTANADERILYTSFTGTSLELTMGCRVGEKSLLGYNTAMKRPS